MFIQRLGLSVLCALFLLLAACGGEEVLEDVVTDGLLITGTVVDSSDLPDPFVPLTIYVANFAASPNILVKRDSFNSIADGTFSYNVLSGRLTQDYTDYGNDTGFLNYYISLLDTLDTLPINHDDIKHYIVVSYDVLFPVMVTDKIIKTAVE